MEIADVVSRSGEYINLISMEREEAVHSRMLPGASILFSEVYVPYAGASGWRLANLQLIREMEVTFMYSYCTHTALVPPIKPDARRRAPESTRPTHIRRVLPSEPMYELRTAHWKRTDYVISRRIRARDSTDSCNGSIKRTTWSVKYQMFNCSSGQTYS